MSNVLTTPVYMMAIDHRWQWVRWCDENRIDHLRIREVKRLAADAFLLARRQSADALESGVLLTDLTFGAEAFARVRAAGAIVGTPAERAGVVPLEWTGAFAESLPGAFVKVLVRHTEEMPREVVEGQLAKVLELQGWCSTVGKPLVLEVLVTGPDEDPAFEREGRPRLLAAYIRSAYARGIVPEFWKIEGVPNAAAMQIVDAAICEQPGVRQLILGKGAGLDAVGTWFESARGAGSAGGFAIGRTVYWNAACDFLLGRRAADDAVHEMAANYRTVIELWRKALITAQPGTVA
jgi:5-dehydro-2-deoxygluconokinase